MKQKENRDLIEAFQFLYSGMFLDNQKALKTALTVSKFICILATPSILISDLVYFYRNKVDSCTNRYKPMAPGSGYLPICSLQYVLYFNVDKNANRSNPRWP